MAEALIDAISSFVEKRDGVFNEYIDTKQIHITTKVQIKLRRAQVSFDDIKINTDVTIHEEFCKKLLLSIMELNEEFQDLRCRMIAPAQIAMGDEERRCIFRTTSNPDAVLRLMDFVRIYNKWTEVSVDYLILRERREYELAKLNTTEVADSYKLTKILEQLAEEYKKKIAEQETQLQEYCMDLQSIAEELNEQYKILDILDKLNNHDFFL